MSSFVGNKFKPGERVTLDGNNYTDCIFERCILVFEGGDPPSIEGCTFESCQYHFARSAGNTLIFLAAMYHGGFRSIVEETFEQIKSNRPARHGDRT